MDGEIKDESLTKTKGVTFIEGKILALLTAALCVNVMLPPISEVYSSDMRRTSHLQNKQLGRGAFSDWYEVPYG